MPAKPGLLETEYLIGQFLIYISEKNVYCIMFIVHIELIYKLLETINFQRNPIKILPLKLARYLHLHLHWVVR